MPEPLQLALDPDHSPSRVVSRDPHNQVNELGIERRATFLTVVERPLPPHELSVPTQDRRRGDHEPRPAFAVDQSSQRGDQHPVPATKARSRVRPLQDRELVAKDQDLRLAFADVRVGSDAKHSSKDEVAEGENHARMIQGPGQGTERRFPTPSRSGRSSMRSSTRACTGKTTPDSVSRCLDGSPTVEEPRAHSACHPDQPQDDEPDSQADPETPEAQSYGEVVSEK